MSAFGTKQTFQSRSVMSAFGGKADIDLTPLNVCFLPKANVASSRRKNRPRWHALKVSAFGATKRGSRV